QLKTEVPEKVAIRNHWSGQWMATNLAIEAMFNLGDILNVIDVAVGQQQHVWLEPTRLEPVACALRRIEQNRAFGCRNEVAVRFKHAAAEGVVRHRILILAGMVIMTKPECRMTKE